MAPDDLFYEDLEYVNTTTHNNTFQVQDEFYNEDASVESDNDLFGNVDAIGEDTLEAHDDLEVTLEKEVMKLEGFNRSVSSAKDQNGDYRDFSFLKNVSFSLVFVKVIRKEVISKKYTG